MPTSLRLIFSEEAARKLGQMQTKYATGIVSRLEAIAFNPFASHPNVERLKGHKDWWRLRKGDWRILYFVDRQAQELKVEAVEHRSNAYRRL
jgi:mRNA-degrading endonuclease RelE of RelBE toxin-antitoxin system